MDRCLAAAEVIESLLLLGKTSRVSVTARRWAQFTGDVGNQAAALLGSQSQRKAAAATKYKGIHGKTVEQENGDMDTTIAGLCA